LAFGRAVEASTATQGGSRAMPRRHLDRGFTTECQAPLG
jgi:hypothetical protein